MMAGAVSSCVHFWDVEPANGPTSNAVCSICGEMAEFLNSIPEEDEPRLRLPGTPKGPKPEPLKEGKMGKGGANWRRSRELRPARERAESLFRQGNDVARVLALLQPEFGHIAAATVQGWRARMKTDETIPEPSQSHTEVIPDTTQCGPADDMPMLLRLLVEMLPAPNAPEARHSQWLDAWVAAYVLVYLGKAETQ